MTFLLYKQNPTFLTRPDDEGCTVVKAYIFSLLIFLDDIFIANSTQQTKDGMKQTLVQNLQNLIVSLNIMKEWIISNLQVSDEFSPAAGKKNTLNIALCLFRFFRDTLFEVTPSNSITDIFINDKTIHQYSFETNDAVNVFTL